MDMNSQSIRSVQFREKVRGYHPSDVDAFVASVAESFEVLERRVKEAESHLAEIQSRSAGSAEAEDSLRRTLVLAQRTADAAVQEAREEAARLMAEASAEREAAEFELVEVRKRVADAAEDEGRTVRARFEEQRAALQADVDALEAHLGRERERLRIYFADQLHRVEEGEPGIAARPEMTGPAPAPAPAPVEESTNVDAETSQDPAGTEAVSGLVENRAMGAAATPPAGSPEDDPFLAELRRAVNDEQPLGPRDDHPEPAEGEADDEQFDLFAKGEDGQGRFGSRLRRRH